MVPAVKKYREKAYDASKLTKAEIDNKPKGIEERLCRCFE
jgi:hypothetical protein